jgi:hypothetical protein
MVPDAIDITVTSSCSAVAVAAGLVTFALGTDRAGSGRVPTAFNSIVGLNSTRGLSLLDLTAVAIPAGFRKDGLPFGVSSIAPAFPGSSKPADLRLRSAGRVLRSCFYRCQTAAGRSVFVDCVA